MQPVLDAWWTPILQAHRFLNEPLWQFVLIYLQAAIFCPVTSCFANDLLIVIP